VIIDHRSMIITDPWWELLVTTAICRRAIQFTLAIT